MCGIAGFWGKGDYQDIEKMTQSIAHRGPDEMGLYQDPRLPLYFGHRRLIVMDKEGGHQPMKTTNEDLIVIYSGQIYNERELRQELESLGHVFQSSHSDTEILIHGYKEWKDKLVDHINGMWAFAIFDRQNKKILLSRDRFGKKPLFYTLQNGIFAFASELKAFKNHKSLNLTISPQGLQKYHAYGYFPKEWTFYNEVRKLQGGCNLIFNLENFQYKILRFWSYTIEPDYTKKEKYWIDAIQHFLREAVERRLVSDVPLGLFLSGGLDSSIVSLFAQQKVANTTLDSFSVGFIDPSFDETAYARFVSHLAGTRHSVVKFSTDLLPTMQKEMFSLLDEPLSDSSLLSYYLLCRHARQKITVALGGDASDELFAGYDTFRALKIKQWIQRIIPRPCHDGITSVLARLPISHSYMTFRFKLEKILMGNDKPASLWNPLWLGPIPSQEIEEMMGEPISLEELYSEAIELWDRSKAENLIDKTLEFYGNLFLQDQILVKVDRISMMHALEVRVPFLDIDLVNCVRKIPAEFKLKGAQTKYILKKALAPYLPAEIVQRKKIGFTAPLGRWFSDGSLEFNLGRYWKLNSKRLIQEKIEAHKSLEADYRLFLWNCYVLNEVTERNSL